jgi:hypothetical protein
MPAVLRGIQVTILGWAMRFKNYDFYCSAIDS